jgi:hypothetical protein
VVTFFVEPLIVVWLVAGFRLKTGWIFTTLFMTSLAFGMIVAGQPDTAAHNYGYVLLCVVGLYLSPFDRFNVQAWRGPSVTDTPPPETG